MFWLPRHNAGDLVLQVPPRVRDPREVQELLGRKPMLHMFHCYAMWCNDSLVIRVSWLCKSCAKHVSFSWPDSWVDVTTESPTMVRSTHTPAQFAWPPQQMEKLLKEAARDQSGRTSAQVSGLLSASISPVTPHSPVYANDYCIASPLEALLLNKHVDDDQLHALFKSTKSGSGGGEQVGTDWIWDWSMKPEYFSKWVESHVRLIVLHNRLIVTQQSLDTQSIDY